MTQSRNIHKKKRITIPNPIKYENGMVKGRICTSCLEFKTCEFFSKSKNKLEGMYPSCKDCCRSQDKESYKNNKELYSKKARKYYINNSEKVKQKSATYAKTNRKKLNSYFYARDRDKRQKSLCKIYLKQMRELYKKAKELGKTLDHIIPLNGKDVSGLHVPWNVQFISFEENASKNNKFDGTYENESWRSSL